MTAKEWKQYGKFTTVFDRKIFVIDKGNANKTLVILHGYPTSSYDYYKVLPELSKHFRVLIHDHLGFGFSDKPTDYSYSLIEQADVALQLWKQLQLQNITLLAHDYGTSVCTEILARHNNKQINLQLNNLILCNGSIHIELSKLRLIQKLLTHKLTRKFVASLTNYPIFKWNIRNVYFNQTKVTDFELQEMWNQLLYNDGRKVIDKISNYINERYFFWHRWITALKRTQIPTKIIWAINDPVAVYAIAELLASEIPNNQLLSLKNTGHFPMLENPDKWLELVLK